MSFAESSIEVSFQQTDRKDHYEDVPVGLYEAERVYNGENEENRAHDEEPVPEETTFRPTFRENEHTTPRERRPSDISLIKAHASFLLYQNEISIQVLSPVVKGDALHKSVVYTIKGTDKHGAFEISRTQDEFIEIRSLMVARWPGSYIPALPPKRLLTKTKADFLEQRRKQFEMFCQNISELTYLHYSAEYQLFLRSTSGDLSLDLMRYQKIDYTEIMARLGKQFSKALEKEATSTDFKKIEEFKEFLQSINGNFVKYKKVLKKVVKARHAYFEQFALLQQTMCSDFEKRVVNGYQGTNSISTAGSETYIADTKEKANKVKETGQAEPIEYLHAWIKLEGREIEAFLEAIGQREKYIALKAKTLDKQRSAAKTLDKVVEGKSTIKTMFSKRGKDEEIEILEKEIANYKKEIELLNTLIDKITLVLSNSEIDKFKKNKVDQYNHVIAMAAQNELVKLKDMSDFWITVLRKKEITSFTNIESA